MPDATIIKLKRPITSADGEIIDSVTVQPLRLSHLIVAGREANDALFGLRLLEKVTGLSEALVRKLKSADGIRIRESMIVATEKPVPTIDPATGAATFRLTAPIMVGGQEVQSLTVQEPDIESEIVADGFKTLFERSAASIAHLSGTTIPSVSQLRKPDFDAIQEFLRPFAMPPESTEATGEMSPSDSAT